MEASAKFEKFLKVHLIIILALKGREGRVGVCQPYDLFDIWCIANKDV